jgi:uncharacterized protein with GYD domain
MAKYMFKVSYSVEGMRGVLKEGAANRANFIEKMIADLGGRMEAFHFAFGETDVFCIAEFPDEKTATAIAIAVGSSGVGRTETVKLLSPEEIDAARQIQTGYRAPG